MIWFFRLFNVKTILIIHGSQSFNLEFTSHCIPWEYLFGNSRTCQHCFVNWFCANTSDLRSCFFLIFFHARYQQLPGKWKLLFVQQIVARKVTICMTTSCQESESDYIRQTFVKKWLFMWQTSFASIVLTLTQTFT